MNLLFGLQHDHRIEPQRLRLVWASAAEGQRLAEAIDRTVEEIRVLGPLPGPRVAVEDAARREALGELERQRSNVEEVPA